MLATLSRVLAVSRTVSWRARQGMRQPETASDRNLQSRLATPRQERTSPSAPSPSSRTGQDGLTSTHQPPPPTPSSSDRSCSSSAAMATSAYAFRHIIGLVARPSDPASPTPSSSDSEDDDLASADTMVNARILAPRPRCYVNPITAHHPAPVSHLVAMVCDNCFDDHAPEDCIVDSYVLDYIPSFVGIVFVSEMEDGEDAQDGIISILVMEDGANACDGLLPATTTDNSEPPQGRRPSL